MKQSLMPYGLYYDSGFVTPPDREKILEWLGTLHPIWEMRYPTKSPLPNGKQQRRLLRPVYWLGNWQFACLDYYRPPHRVKNVAVSAEGYPEPLERLVKKAEKITRQILKPADIPRGWHLNTCLINFYGNQDIDGKKIDCARVGEHKDFEPGPVASISFGERAFFQFVKSAGRGLPSRPVFQQWLADSSLQIFGGKKWKDETFHRVQRVDRKMNFHFPLPVENFDTRRINFTFRYVPDVDIVPFRGLPAKIQIEVEDYVRELAQHSDFFKKELERKS